MMNDPMMKFLFETSQDDVGLEEGEALERLFARLEEADSIPVDRKPLAKALKALGLSLDVDKDATGLVACFDDEDSYSDAVTILSDPMNLATLVGSGWVASFGGDVTQTREQTPSYRIFFIEVAETAQSTADSPENLEKAVKKGRKNATTPASNSLPLEKAPGGAVGAAKDGPNATLAKKPKNESARDLVNKLID